MAFFAGRVRKILPIIGILLLFIPVQTAFAQDESPHEPLDIAVILHPPPGSEVAPLDTLILIKIDDFYVGDDHFYLILLDDREVTAQWNHETRTFTYYPDRMLEIGEHTVKVYMTVIDGPVRQLVAQGTFFVGTGGRPSAPSAPGTLFDLGALPVISPPPSPVDRRGTPDFFSLSGRTSISAAFVEMNGLGARLRQEPDSTSIFNLTGRGRSDDLNYDFRLYITSDENKYQQPRNRYVFNIEENGYGFSVGDTTPRLSPLVIDGMRARGAHGWGIWGPVTVHLAEGQVRRETESKYDEQGHLTRRGMGEQRLWVTRLALWDNGPFTVGFNYLRGKEEPSDTEGVGNPGENTVSSVDATWKFDDDNGSVRAAWAESSYDFDDPDDEDTSGEEAREIEALWNVSGHRLKARWQLIEPGFASLGRRSLQKDRELWGIEDRISLWRGGLTGRLYLEKFHNNVNGDLDFTTSTTRYGGQLRYRLGRELPTLTFGLIMQDRANDVEDGETGWIDESMETINLGFLQTFNFIDARHDLRVDWRSTDRNNTANSLSDSTQETITVTMTSRWSKGFRLNLLYGTTDSKYPGRDRFTDVERVSVRGSYTPRSRLYSIWARWEMVDSEGNQATYDSERETLEFGLKWMFATDLSIEASLKCMDFDDISDNANDFSEHTFRIMLIQTFN